MDLNVDQNLAVFHPDTMGPDEAAISQMQTCLAAEEGAVGALCADHHKGYSMPIGGVAGYENYISPSGVGYDIGCGNKAVATSLLYSDIRVDLPRIMDEISRRISFGMGRPNDEPADHPILDRIRTDAPMDRIRDLQGLAVKQLGTVGSGNHYVDLFREEGTDRVWIGVHFGSRGFGHKVASGFLALAQGKAFNDHPAEGEMDAPPTLLDVRSPLGYSYIEAMTLAGEYAYAGRDTVINKVLEILGNPGVFDEVHNHHNFAWKETHNNRDLWVVRKGATPLFPGQRGFVGGSMGEHAVIIEGNDYELSADGLRNIAKSSLSSAPHGAGRVMSRTQAKGKSRRRSHCDNCGWTQAPSTPAEPTCPECLHKTKKTWVQESKGVIDWPSVQAQLAADNIILRGGDADEAPGAYKRLPEVLEAHAPYVRVQTWLKPIGVVMAGSGTHDPYKD